MMILISFSFYEIFL